MSRLHDQDENTCRLESLYTFEKKLMENRMKALSLIKGRVKVSYFYYEGFFWFKVACDSTAQMTPVDTEKKFAVTTKANVFQV